jgi:hypothetical protein
MRRHVWLSLIASILATFAVSLKAGQATSANEEVAPSAPANRPSGVTIFANVNVLTMRTKELLRKHAVVVRNGLIAEVKPMTSVQIATDATVIDGQGGFLMPGLADMHVHVMAPDAFLSFLAYGVTTVANLNGSPTFLRWRQLLADGELTGPNLYTTGPSVDGRALNPTFVTARTPEQARAIVADQKRRGYDWIKVYSTLKPEVYYAILAAAKDQEIAVVGHLPLFMRDPADLKRGLGMVAHGEEFVGGLFRGLNPERIPRITRSVKEAGITVTPNLVAYTIMLTSVRELNRVLDDPECAYLSPAAWSEWLPRNNRYSNRDARTFGPGVEAGHAFMARFIKAFNDAGVPLLIGTDTEVLGFPGRSTHEEIHELAGAGLSPYDALSAATRNAGDFVVKTVPGAQAFGTVAVGQRADLILLSANPLENLANLKQLTGVMVRGRWWPSTRIAEMREEVARRYQPIKRDVARLDTLIGQKNVDEAAKVFRALRTAYPRESFFSQAVLHRAADQALTTGRTRDALTLAEMNAELHADQFAIQVQLGRIYRTFGDQAAVAKAAASFETALKLDPTNTEAKEELTKLKKQAGAADRTERSGFNRSK